MSGSRAWGSCRCIAFDEGFQAAVYYTDPDQNVVELNVNYYGNDWTATEHMKASPAIAQRPQIVPVDPERMIAARKAGASAWELHERSVAGEFAPAKPYEWQEASDSRAGTGAVLLRPRT